MVRPSGAQENAVGGFLPIGGVTDHVHLFPGNSIAPAGADFSHADQPGMLSSANFQQR
jgi:hypothetical protein